MNIILLGPQGSGKGTQAKRLAAAHGFAHIATGDMIREMKELPTALGRDLKATYDRGDLVSDELMIRLMRERLERDDTRQGFILDGFPRTLAQARALDELLEELDRRLDVVFELEVGDRDVLLARMAKRAAEEGRTDDTPAAISHRLELYERETAPLVDHYRESGPPVIAVAGWKTVDEVFQELESALSVV